MAVAIPPAPIGEPQGSFAWDQWYLSLQVALGTTGAIAWDLVDKAGSDIADIAARDHASLQNMQGGTTGERYHLTLAQQTVIAAGFAQGVYTPTLTNTTNLDASTAYECQYMRVGATVTVSGKVDVDPTAAASTVLGISLPIASNIGATEDLAGTAANPAAQESAALLGDAANNRATMQWIAVGTANRTMYFTFTYQVI